MNDTAGTCAVGGCGVLGMIIQLAIGILMLVATWRIFVKAGQPGWAVLIPFYNIYVFLKIAGKPGWWLLLFFVPILNIVVGIIALAAFARNFDKGVGFVVGMIFLPFIFYPILGFGDAQFVGASQTPAQAT